MLGGDKSLEQLAHRLGKGVEADRILDDCPGGVAVERLVIGKIISGAREIAFGALVVTAMNRLVGALEERCFAVVHEFLRYAARGRGRRNCEEGISRRGAGWRGFVDEL